ncbi:MAG TPA: dienelactone hydrolase family protein [Acidimicrobiales bacterium]|nr:dienelactone hydrolase family protein [Acidimicrobiales bacterium]
MQLTLPSGTAAYRAEVPDAARGVVVIPDIGGLRPLFTDLCDRLAAEHGWAVASFEPWPGREGLSLDERLAAVGTLDDTTVLADVAGAADALGVEPVAVVGFCMGGMFALKAAAAGRVDRAVSFYGMVRLPEHWRSATVAEPLETLAGGAVPILQVTGTEDPWVPAADAAALEGTGAEVVRYPGADHGFVHDPSRPTHRPDDAADAWRRVATFLA